MTASHVHRWRFREIAQPGMRQTRIKYRCDICAVLAVIGATGGLEAPSEDHT